MRCKIIMLLLISIIFISCDDQNEKLFEADKDELNNRPVIERFYFVGLVNIKSGIYKYDLKAKKHSHFWSSRTERVIDLVYSDDYKTIFFVTGKNYGIAGAFPFIESARLYRLDPINGQVNFINNLGDAIQISSFWEDDNFNLVMNSFDKKANTYIHQTKQRYSRFGKILSDETETSDLLISGYPKFIAGEIPFESLSGKYKVYNNADSIFIRNNDKKAKSFIKKSSLPITAIGWAEDRSFLILTFGSKLSDMKSGAIGNSFLTIFDLKKKKVIKEFPGHGYKRFALTRNFLIFDDGFRRTSNIRILTLSDLKDYGKIVISGGCGLRNIPINPFEKN